MDVVSLHGEESRDIDIEPRVVQGGEDAAEYDEEYGGVEVAGNEVDRQQVQVLPAEELYRVDIDGVSIASTGCLLPMMVLMYQRVDRSEVEELVEAEVAEVVEQVEAHQGAKSVANGQLAGELVDGGCEVHHLRSIVHEEDGGQLVDCDEYHV